MSKRTTLMSLALLILALLGSLLLNYLLFDKAVEFYSREAAVRMRPIDFRYADENQQLLSEPKTRTRLVIFGESRANMWRNEPPQNWGDLQIVNRGIGGETTPQILGRLDADVLALDPDIVVLQMGDNDLKTMAVLPGTREQAIESTFQNITDIARRISDQGIEVVITTIFPPAPIELLRAPLWSDEVNESIDLVNQRLLALSYPRVTVADCDRILRDGKHINSAYAIDTLHLNVEGYRALNAGLEPTMLPIVERASSR